MNATERTNITVKSNIYVRSPETFSADGDHPETDAQFTAQIYNVDLLERLRERAGTNGTELQLTDIQRRLSELRPCDKAPEGEITYGVVMLDGEPVIECRCSVEDCPDKGKCLGGAPDLPTAPLVPLSRCLADVLWDWREKTISVDGLMQRFTTRCGENAPAAEFCGALRSLALRDDGELDCDVLAEKLLGDDVPAILTSEQPPGTEPDDVDGSSFAEGNPGIALQRQAYISQLVKCGDTVTLQLNDGIYEIMHGGTVIGKMSAGFSERFMERRGMLPEVLSGLCVKSVTTFAAAGGQIGIKRFWLGVYVGGR